MTFSKIQVGSPYFYTLTKTLEEPKDPAGCNVFQLYRTLASTEAIATMADNYHAGNYGYGHAKQALFELLWERFSDERELFNYYLEHPEEVAARLQLGEEKARAAAAPVMERIRDVLGFA